MAPLDTHAICLLVFLFLVISHHVTSCYTAIFSFGDSLADTGNSVAIDGHSANDAATKLPYGETYFGRPTGRFSDGRLIIDFIAQAMGLPFVRPYLAGGSEEEFRHGVNFAVAGATAMNNSFFREQGIDVTWTPYSLDVQIEWFKQLLHSNPSISDPSVLSNALFLVGEIGGNDYNHPFFQHEPFDKIRKLVPSVIEAISSAITALVKLGAKNLVVPGNFPIGCVPLYLRQFQSKNVEDYDQKTGCIKWLNEFSVYHNRLLQDELDHLNGVYHNATITYADYYNAAMRIFDSPKQFGFTTPLTGCCRGCGESLCEDPSRYVSWDGLHLTEAAYKTIADGLLQGPARVPSLNQTCSVRQQSSASPNSLKFFTSIDSSRWFDVWNVRES
ncbi:GDSL esterase/lipase At1g31550-like isoform X2 [Zingiber officinale]|uniref:GDSL esterase/lipase At1g31550-like isoform X2 n=1 Tax=Zingiber officinale TaxID=94328 RepID=UPI001C4A86E7|nr:GDSL esterase/lipase At1g31550-like isoform X2 [Zingiber officinale]